MAGACPAFPEVGWRMDVFSSAGQSPASLRSCCHPARGRTNILRSLLLPGRDPVGPAGKRSREGNAGGVLPPLLFPHVVQLTKPSFIGVFSVCFGGRRSSPKQSGRLTKESLIY